MMQMTVCTEQIAKQRSGLECPCMMTIEQIVAKQILEFEILVC